MRRVPGWSVLAAALLAAGCAPAAESMTVAAPAVAPTPSVAPAPPPLPPAPAAGRQSRAPAGTTGVAAARTRVVVLDPGHNGGNAAHPDRINRQVDAGAGRTKACNTVGTGTAAGYPEHAFAWDVALRTRALLAARGVRVVLTRPTDTGVGPCVDVRGRSGAAARADAVVSVHADGAAPGGSGFHVIEAAGAPAGPAVATAAHRLAVAVHGALATRSGLAVADYVAGGDGYDARTDLAGLTLAGRPAIVVEAGNMRNAHDAAVQSTAAGRQRIAAALAAGVLSYLGLR